MITLLGAALLRILAYITLLILRRLVMTLHRMVSTVTSVSTRETCIAKQHS